MFVFSLGSQLSKLKRILFKNNVFLFDFVKCLIISRRNINENKNVLFCTRALIDKKMIVAVVNVECNVCFLQHTFEYCLKTN